MQCANGKAKQIQNNRILNCVLYSDLCKALFFVVFSHCCLQFGYGWPNLDWTNQRNTQSEEPGIDEEIVSAYLDDVEEQ